MQICTSPQTDNHTSTPPLSFLQDGCPSCHPTNSIKALKAYVMEIYMYNVACETHKQKENINYYYITTILWLSGLRRGQSKWAGIRRNIHPLTPIVVINHPLSASSIFLQSMASSLFNLRALQFFFTESLSKLSLIYLLAWHLPLHTRYICSPNQSLSSFCSTCPYHRNLFCCSTEIMSSNPSLSLSQSFTWNSIL